MGLCASVSSSSHSKTHEDYDTYGHENAVYYRGIFSCGSNTNGSSSSTNKIGSTHSHPGSKYLNQDSAILYQGYGTEDGVLCAVFDGHGKNGHIVSKLVRNRLPTLLLNQRNALMTKTCSPSKQNLDLSSSPNKNFIKREEAFVSAFKVMDKEIKLLDSLDCSCSGTTASVVVKQGSDLVIANLGDTRVVLGTRTTENGIEAVQLTTDLKPGVPSEAERIRKCNGRVLALKDEPHIQRVWLPNDDSPGLAMSRAFGDFVLKNHGIIAIPDVSFHHISPNDEFLVIASDGVWDVLSNDQVMSVVSSARDGDAAAKAVVDAAIASWKRRFPNSKRDDCTVTCLFL